MYCKKLQQSVDGVTTCLNRAANCLPAGHKKCLKCSFIPYLEIFNSSRYSAWPSGLSIVQQYVRESEVVNAAVFDKEHTVVNIGALVEVPGVGRWVKVIDFVRDPDHAEVGVRVSIKGVYRVFGAKSVRVVSPPRRWKIRDLVVSAVNPHSIYGEVVDHWIHQQSRIKWIIVKTPRGRFVERADVLMEFEGTREDIFRESDIPAIRSRLTIHPAYAVWEKRKKVKKMFRDKAHKRAGLHFDEEDFNYDAI